VLPKALLLDLDDTILNDSGHADDCWIHACADGSVQQAGVDHARLIETIFSVRDWYWGDADRHRAGRLDLGAARREIVRLSLAAMGLDDAALADRVGDAYSDHRERRMEPFPDAIDTIRWFRQSGCRLALLTNGGATGQRAKIDRFDLGDLFDLILIEGELGFGKPDARVFERALGELDVEPSDAWMVGDNLEWDVAPPQRLGMFAVWVDVRGRGVPDTSAIRPDRIVRTLSELRQLQGTA
jgi:putative hydrolase of the HAD superfamily